MKKHVIQIITIVLLLAAGRILGGIIPFPAPLISMILFLILLLTNILNEEHYRGGLSDLILKNLAFFFLPPALRVLGSLDLFEGVVVKLLLVMLISNVLIMGVTGMVTQKLLKGEHHD